jgi:sodium-dependent dicarboxylate transporter 2/3/5
MKNKEASDLGSAAAPGGAGSGWVKRIGLVLGPVLYLSVLLLGQGALEAEALAVGAAALWMACWWMTEAIPLPATALLPIVLFPASGAVPAKEVTLSYGHPVIFLFLGGFLISAAFKKSGLARRVALRAVGLFGLDPRRVVLGIMAATALLSMWISNTACVVMMVPIALGVATQVQGPEGPPGPSSARP